MQDVTPVTMTIPGHAIPSVRITARTKWTERAKRYLDWQKHVASYCGCGPVPWDSLYVQYEFYIYGKRHGDLTNLIKSTEDGLQYGKCIPNDKAVHEVHGRLLYCSSPEEERVEVTVSKAEL